MKNFKSLSKLTLSSLITFLSIVFIAAVINKPSLIILGLFIAPILSMYINKKTIKVYASIVMILIVSTSFGCTNNSNNQDLSLNESTFNDLDKLFEGYKLIEVDGGNLSGHREPNVVVDIGFGEREYYAFTNEYGQLVKVIAKKIVLQNDKTEPVTSKGRYYEDEAKVPGVESKTLDEGHIIADSLGGVSNAYNITPQNSTLNRHGDQAYMEEAIREAGGCTDFEAIITYPNTTTQIPSHYSYKYTIKGNKIQDEFDNVNPDEVNANLSSNSNKSNTVFWTPKGKSYHTTKSCPTLSKSKKILSGTIKESGKNDPCNECAK